MLVTVPVASPQIFLAIAQDVMKQRGVADPEPTQIERLAEEISLAGLEPTKETDLAVTFDVPERVIDKVLGKVTKSEERILSGVDVPDTPRRDSRTRAETLSTVPSLDRSGLLEDAHDSPLAAYKLKLPKDGAHIEKYGVHLERLHLALTEYAKTASPVVAEALQGAGMKKILEQCAESIWTYVEPTITESACTFDKSERAQHMASRMADNFVRNIHLACERVTVDLEDVGKAFGLEGKPKLVDISSSGSDFHKGGKQVLMLTFIDATGEPKKIVYKPSDVESDALIVGNQKGSLATMLNATLPEDCRLPTYTILAKNPGSEHSGKLAVRESYGYIQFLESPPRTEREGRITVPESARMTKKELTTYLHQCGAWLATAVSFGIKDLHAGNLMVHHGRPFVIDLEFAFHGALARLKDTSLIGDGPLSGICGQFEMDLGLDRNHALKPSHSSIALEDGRALSLNRDLAPALYEGYLEGMFAVAANLPGFTQRLQAKDVQNSVGRYNVFSTGKLFDEGISALWGKAQLTKPIPEMEDLAETFATFGKDEIGIKANTLIHTWQDFMNGDLPAFYHRASSREVVDSAGRPIEGYLLPQPTVTATIGGLAELGTKKKALARMCAHLGELTSACNDKAAAREVIVGGVRFRKPEDSAQWSAA
ncbi:MAG: DUF4135 domain-containing protein [Deltaproteobacteria bacterium]|nr:DUF4135 domain-containing protein [Deltaproteobacteria bacterium]